MKAILMSIQSKWLAKILNGEKTAELRKRFPKDYRGWMYLYCTKAKPYLLRFFWKYFIADDIAPIEKDDGLVKNGLVVARVWVDDVEEITYEQLHITTANSGQIFNEYLTYTLREKALLQKSCLESEELYNYLWRTKSGKAIHFSKLEIFDKPKELGEFYYYKKRWVDCGMDCPPYFDEVKTQVRKAPQSWQYIYIEEVI